jgi:hypothetical protein
MPSRLPRLPSGEPIDLRIAAAVVVLTLALAAPGIAHALGPVDDQGLDDAASTLESQAREAMALIDHRDGTTDLAFSAELQDLAGAADEARTSLLHQAVRPDAVAKRDQLADVAARLVDAADDASLALGDRQRLTRDRAALAGAAQALHELRGGP